MTDTDTSAEAVERVRKYVDWPYTSPDTVILDSDLVRITASDISTVLAERDYYKDRAEQADAGLREIAKPRSPFNEHAGLAGSFDGDLRAFARATLAQIDAKPSDPDPTLAKDCGHYPESLTKMTNDHIEELEAEVDYLRRWQNAAFWANANIDIDIDKCPEAQEELKGKADE